MSSGRLFTSGTNQAAGLLGLPWRLFDFGSINAQIKQARGRDAEALAAYRLAVSRTTEDVEDAFSGLVNRGEQTATLTQGEAALVKCLRILVNWILTRHCESDRCAARRCNAATA